MCSLSRTTKPLGFLFKANIEGIKISDNANAIVTPTAENRPKVLRGPTGLDNIERNPKTVVIAANDTGFITVFRPAIIISICSS